MKWSELTLDRVNKIVIHCDMITLNTMLRKDGMKNLIENMVNMDHQF